MDLISFIYLVKLEENDIFKEKFVENLKVVFQIFVTFCTSKQDFISSNSMIAWIFERQDIYKNLSELMRKHG